MTFVIVPVVSCFSFSYLVQIMALCVIMALSAVFGRGLITFSKKTGALDETSLKFMLRKTTVYSSVMLIFGSMIAVFCATRITLNGAALSMPRPAVMPDVIE